MQHFYDSISTGTISSYQLVQRFKAPITSSSVYKGSIETFRHGFFGGRLVSSSMILYISSQRTSAQWWELWQISFLESIFIKGIRPGDQGEHGLIKKINARDQGKRSSISFFTASCTIPQSIKKRLFRPSIR